MKIHLSIVTALICLSAGHGTVLSQTVEANPSKTNEPSSPPKDANTTLLDLLGAWEPDEKAIRSALAKGADPNAVGILDSPALITAVLNVDTTMGGRQPQDEAKSAAWLAIVKLLLDSGANPNKPHQEPGLLKGFTPLMAATAHNLPRAVELLLQYKADVKAESVDGATALVYATRENAVPTMKLLVNAGADVNPRNDFDPLLTATTCGNIEALSFLLSCHADVNVTNMKGQTPLACVLKSLDARMNDRVKDADRISKLKSAIQILREHGGKQLNN